MSSDNEKIGKVKEVIGDNSQSKVKYLVISGSSLHPVPWTACTVSKTEKESRHERATDANEDGKKKMSWGDWGKGKSTITLNMSKDQFSNAPTVESTNLDQFTNTSLQQQVDSFYSSSTSSSTSSSSSSSSAMSGTQKGMTESQSSTNLFKASDAIGMKVKDTADQTTGKIKDVVIDSARGDLAFGLVSFSAEEGIGGKIAAVPWRSLSISNENKVATLDATKDKLEMAVLEKGDISKLSDRQFANRIYTEFGEQPYWGVYGYEPGTEQKPTDTNVPPKEPNSTNKGYEI
jgi:sporulation protein YlmC with PRC-barrel domain